MSLINDALKRAKQAQKIKPSAPSAGPPLQPHEGNHGSSKWPILLLIAILALGGGGYWYFFMRGKPPAIQLPDSVAGLFKGKGNGTNAAKSAASAIKGTNKLAAAKTGTRAKLDVASTTAPGPSSGMKVTAPAPAPAKAQPHQNSITNLAMAKPEMTVTSEVPPAKSSESTETASVSQTQNGALAAAKEAAQPSAPLKLQGIFYRLSKPSVLINGQTLYRGDSIQGSRVVEISRHSVTLEKDGQSQTLAFSQK